jgi:hypothetical protein
MYQQLWGYKVEDKLYLGVREQKRFNTTDLYSLIALMMEAVRTSETSFNFNVPTLRYIPERFKRRI